MRNKPMKNINNEKKKKTKKSPIFLIALFNFLIIILIAIYLIYLRFIPYMTLTFDGYAVTGTELVSNLQNTNFNVSENIEALKVKDQDTVYKNLKSYYLGNDKKQEINLEYPIYVNDTLALYNLSSDTMLYTDDLKMIQGYSGFVLTLGSLYNANTLERADYNNYILMKNSDNLYINTHDIKINTKSNKYTIQMNSIINFTDEFITYYTLKDGFFIYGKILDVEMNSDVMIDEYNKQYTYKELLIGLDIIQEEKKVNKEENIVEENKTEENKIIEEKEEIKEENKLEENKVEENITQEENTTQENIIQSEVQEEPIDENNNVDDGEIKWQKPTVSCTEFIANTYTATTEISMSDPSGAISKALTFTFYKDGEITFRVSATSSGLLKVSKLIPNTEYNVIGTYQYTNQDGSVIEVKFLDQNLKTLGTEKIRPIDLSFRNGQIYPDKIELQDLKIASDITDEAIYGVSRAEIEINGTVYPISSSNLRSILQGQAIKFESSELAANTKYKYKIKFYDTAENEMKLTNNTGATLTSKAKPSAEVKVTESDLIAVNISIILENPDEVEMKNYRYVVYASSGKIQEQNDLSINTDTLTLKNLDPDEVYTIKIYADFDIEDGNGLKENQEIGDAIFITKLISQLGSVKFNVTCDTNNDITDNSIKFNTTINTIKTNQTLIQILNKVKIEITNENGNKIKTIDIDDINKLTTDGIISEVDNLESNTKYNIVITATAKQGSVEEEVKTSYTFTSFRTRKKKAEMYIKNEVVTTNLIDFDIIVYDKDGASLDGIYKITLKDASGKPVETKELRPNEFIRCKFEDLMENEKYTLTCYSDKYNETDNDRLIESNYIIGIKDYVTQGLEGNVDLIGLNREKQEIGKNLIDVESNNNWYSKTFDVIKTGYENDPSDISGQEKIFKIESTRNYGKQYDKHNKILTLQSNQCYVYDLSDYIGETVTISFKAKISNVELQDGIYLQKGKQIGKNIEKIEGLKSTDWTNYTKTLKVPDDGYLGFYLSKDSTNTLQIQYLQVEKGEQATEYEDYSYQLVVNIRNYFIDENYVTFEGKENEEKYSKYYIRLSYGNNIEEYTYINNEKEFTEDKSYVITEPSETTEYKIELIIKVYDREYVLNTISFTYDPDNCTEIKSISNESEFKDIQPYGNYILLSDLKLMEQRSISEYTYGNANISFYGSIDFNGKTIQRDIYSETIDEECTSYIFYDIAKSAKINNLVIDLYIDNEDNRIQIASDNNNGKLDGIYSLFLYNNSTIDNLMLNLIECNERNKINIGLIGYNNKGTIENFVINLNRRLYGEQNVAGVCLYSSGVIQNGYMYGEGIEATQEFVDYDERNIAGLVYELSNGSITQNIYNLTQITINHHPNSESYAANIAYNVGAGAIVRNVFSVEPFRVSFENYIYENLLDRENKEINKGPNILNNSGNVQISYYFCDTVYEDNDYNTRQDITALADYNFQENLLNANNYNQFIVQRYVQEGYYPHLNLNKCMPNQPNLEIEMNSFNDLLDIQSSEVIQEKDLDEEIRLKVKDTLDSFDFSDENIQLAVFHIYNPSGKNIVKLNINYLDTDIIYQTYEKRISTVYAVLHNPTTYINKYNIASVTGKNISGRETIVYFGEQNVDTEKQGEVLGERTIDATFTGYIGNAEQWDNIDSVDQNGVSGLIQNYKLVADIDFGNSEFTPSITGRFTGNIDGQSHILSNITSDKSLFNILQGNLKNLFINSYNVSSTEGYVGLINRFEEGIIDNIHITDETLYTFNKSSDIYIGGICGYITGQSSIKNSSVNGLNVQIIEDVTRNNQHAIGGIAGYCAGTNIGTIIDINNCYVTGLDVNVSNIAIYGIGGILGISGTSGNSNLNIQYCYTEGKIITDRAYAGGIYGRWSYNSNSSFVRYCYSLVNITGNMSTGNEYIGGIGGYSSTAANTTNNLYVGNIYIKKLTTTNSRRIVGNQENSKNYNNYAYDEQIINGNKTNTLYGATALLTYDQIFELSTYTDKLKFGEDKKYYQYSDLEQQYFPKLYSTYNKLLPNQKDMILENGIKVVSIKYDYTEDNKALEVTIELENIEHLEITGAVIEDMIPENVGSWNIEENDIYTTIIFRATPSKYYDTYKLTEIKYKNKLGEERSLDTPVKISMPFYKEIASVDDWNTKIDETSAENYKLVNDIDFENRQDINTNVSIGRLEADSTHTISNLTLQFNTQYNGFIKELKTSMKNINFRGFTITGKASNIGLIYQNSGAITNCNFEDINIDVPGYDYIAIVSRSISGASVDTVTMNNIKVSGRHYIGGFNGYKNSSGTFKNINATRISITGTGNYVGGILGYATGGSISNLKAYQYTSTGKQENDEETSYLVKGGAYVGGCVGYSWAALTNIETTYSTITATGTNIGGCIGFTASANGVISNNNSITSSSSMVGGCIGAVNGSASNITSTNNTIIKGTTNVGGCIGKLTSGAANTNILSQNNLLIEGSSTNVGGCIGSATGGVQVITGIASTNNKIKGTESVGGCIGYSEARIRNAKTNYDSLSADVNIEGTNSVGGIVGIEIYNTTSISGTTYFSITGAYTTNANISGSNYVGGISGQGRGTIYATAVDNSKIKAEGESAGGLVGYYSGTLENNATKIKFTSFNLMHSFVANSTISANSNTGGLVGLFKFGNIQYCYAVNNIIMATESCAGGLIGYINNEQMTSQQYRFYIRYNYIANTKKGTIVQSQDKVGGLIGHVNKTMELTQKVEIEGDDGEFEEQIQIIHQNNIKSNLVVTNIAAETDFASMGIGSIGDKLGLTEIEKSDKIYVFNKSNLKQGNITTSVDKDADELLAYNVVSGDELKQREIFTSTEELNFGTGNFEYEDGYFPTLQYLSSGTNQTYWSSTYLNVIQEKVQIPSSSLQIQAFSLANFAMMTSMFSMPTELPTIYTYVVDVDKINIEFSDILPYTYFEVKTSDDTIIERSLINERVYTLEYDFTTPITITILNMDNWYTKEIRKEDVQNLLDIMGDEYLYISENKLYSNKKEIDGDFVNIYNGKALTSSGKIYDISTMNVLDDKIKLELLDKQSPITETIYNDIKIQTFYHCSKVIQNDDKYTYKDQQIFIKNGQMYLVDGDIQSVGNSIIIDSYNNNRYEAVLGTDGRIYDLLTEIKYPAKFKNQDIIAMTNNLNSNNNIVLVYYSSGKVYGFNYITGEEVFNNGKGNEDVNFVSYLLSSFSVRSLLYNMEEEKYIEAQELQEKLEHTSIEQALIDLSQEEKDSENTILDTQENINDIDSSNAGDSTIIDIESDSASELDNNSNTKPKNDTASTNSEYITTYDAKTGSYVVYNTDDLLKTDLTSVESENDKINKSDDLISYYTNMSTSKMSIKSIGITVFIVIVILICIILVIMYRKNSKENR